MPASDIDIVALEDARAVLHPGAVIAAVDFGEHNAAQLQLASITAAIAHQPLILMTVLSPGDGSSEHDAAAALRRRAHKLTPIRPDAVIVRRGEVAEEIARCASHEAAGLVVMGLRAGCRGQRPGAIARAVLARKRPFVLAVPAAAVIGD